MAAESKSEAFEQKVYTRIWKQIVTGYNKMAKTKENKQRKRFHFHSIMLFFQLVPNFF